MKIFNVSLRVVITQIAEIPDNPDMPAEPEPEKFDPLNDDPMKKQKQFLDKYMERAEKLMVGGPRPFPGMLAAYSPDQQEGASMSRNVKVQAETFEDLSAILAKFNEAAKSLHAIPDSLLEASVPHAPSPFA
jgi:hypothetical protein